MKLQCSFERQSSVRSCSGARDWDQHLEYAPMHIPQQLQGTLRHRCNEEDGMGDHKRI